MEPTEIPIDAHAIRRYLLGTPAPAEREQIELRLLTDREFFDEVSASEDDLLDEYLGGRLTARERESFEGVFLAAPERQQKLRFAQALRRRIDTPAVVPSPADAVATPDRRPVRPPARAGFLGRISSPRARAAFASVAVLASAGAILIAVRAPWPSATPPPAPVAADRAAMVSEPRETPAPAAQPNNRENARPKTVAVRLTPGLTRGDERTRRVIIPAGTEFVRLELQIAAVEYAEYTASVQNIEGGAVAALTGLTSDSAGGDPAVVAVVPASMLAPGDYRVKLSGHSEGGSPEPIDTYGFRIPRP